MYNCTMTYKIGQSHLSLPLTHISFFFPLFLSHSLTLSLPLTPLSLILFLQSSFPVSPSLRLSLSFSLSLSFFFLKDCLGNSCSWRKESFSLLNISIFPLSLPKSNTSPLLTPLMFFFSSFSP
uniref:Uncharacterized protein n=1 Tax=Cacopsylla melanoneura TaxID=428564 RepID=A0A8D8TIN6_9HEMI